MFYRVTARLRTETGADFLRKLTDGTIKSQSPDGREIVDAMNRAVLTDDGSVCGARSAIAGRRLRTSVQRFSTSTLRPWRLKSSRAIETTTGARSWSILPSLSKRNETEGGGQCRPRRVPTLR